MEHLDLTKQAGGSYSHPDPTALLRKTAPRPERGERYPSGHDSELDVDKYMPSERNAGLDPVPAIADPTLVQPDNRRTTAGWDSEQSNSEPRDGFDAADVSLAAPVHPRDVTLYGDTPDAPVPSFQANATVPSGWDTKGADDPRHSADAADADLASPVSPNDVRTNDPTLDCLTSVRQQLADQSDDDSGDDDDVSTKARHPLTGRFVASPSAQQGEPERVRDAAVAMNAREPLYPGSGTNRTPGDILAGIVGDIDAAMGRANRVGRNGNDRNQRNVQPTAPVPVTPRG
jgi:hypothetical protein